MLNCLGQKELIFHDTKQGAVKGLLFKKYHKKPDCVKRVTRPRCEKGKNKKGKAQNEKIEIEFSVKIERGIWEWKFR